ncbi:hypothetical protein ZIOFF_046981 [Zingiber officinale]|uniref:Uncharacterized protein n=1 Tax=Zingiber officinale TaxID=94328 RepID=A0A8J5KWB2_ZINOF|nr:hypothetical protein ZIOFF_046981 [Zingiber officinale]
MAAASDAEKISDKSFSSNDTAFGLGERGPILSRLDLKQWAGGQRPRRHAYAAGALPRRRTGGGAPYRRARRKRWAGTILLEVVAGAAVVHQRDRAVLPELGSSYFSGLASTAAAPSASSPTTAVLPAGLPCSPASASRSRRATSFVSYCNAETAHTPPPRPTPPPSAASMAAVAGAEIAGDALMP